jgi:hypothetical protein
VEGPSEPIVSQPAQREERNAVSLSEMRVTAESGAEVVVEVRVPVRTASAWWVEQTFIEPADVPGLSLGPVSAKPDGTLGAWDAVRFRIPFSAEAPLENVAIGNITAVLRLGHPAVVEVGNPELETEVAGQPDFQFVPTNETGGRLAIASYGSATVTDGFVRRAASRLDNLEFVRRFRGGELDRHQDIYAFRRT